MFGEMRQLLPFPGSMVLVSFENVFSDDIIRTASHSATKTKAPLSIGLRAVGRPQLIQKAPPLDMFLCLRLEGADAAPFRHPQSSIFSCSTTKREYDLCSL